MFPTTCLVSQSVRKNNKTSIQASIMKHPAAISCISSQGSATRDKVASPPFRDQDHSLVPEGKLLAHEADQRPSIGTHTMQNACCLKPSASHSSTPDHTVNASTPQVVVKVRTQDLPPCQMSLLLQLIPGLSNTRQGGKPSL